MAATATTISDKGVRIRRVVLTGRLQHWPTRHWTPSDRVAAGLVALQMAALGTIAFPGSFYGDDLPRMSQAARSPLSWQYLTDEVFGHLAPGYRLVYWLQVHAAPLHHGITVFVSLAAQAAATALFWLLLRRLFGPRPLLLAPLAVYAFSAAQLPSFLWWSAAVNLLPAQLALLTAMLAHLHVLSGQRRGRVIVIAAIVVGMLFWEKVALLLIELPLLTLALTTGSWRQRCSRVVGLWRVWLAYSYPVAIFLLLFLIGEYGSPRETTHPVDIAKFVGVTLSQGLAPALLGGPVTWSRDGPYFSVAAPTTTLTAAFCLILVAYCIGCLRRHPHRATAGLLLLLVPVVLSAVVTAMTRYAFFGFAVARDYRYLADLLIPALVGLSLAGLRPAFRLREDDGRSDARSPDAGPTAGPRGGRLVPATVGGLAVALFTATTSISAYRYAVVWQENPVGSYLAAARASLVPKPGEAAPGLYDLAVPHYVLDPVYAPENHISRVLAPLRSQPVYDSPGHLMGVLDARGHATGVRLETTSVSAPGPDGECHWFAADGDVTVQLLALAPDDAPVLTVYYLANEPTPVSIDTRHGRSRASTFSTHAPLLMQKGLGTLIVQAAPDRAIDSIEVYDLTADVCVLRVDVQRALPVTDSETQP